MLNQENGPKTPETAVEHWVTMRPEGLGLTHREEYGAIAWTPGFIPEGNRLEIDIGSLNQLAASLKLEFPLEIVSYNPPREQPTIQVDGPVSPRGAAIFGAFLVREKKPTGVSGFLFDDQSKKARILINFSGLADELERKLTAGRANPSFYTAYAGEVNQALTSKLTRASVLNWVLKARDNEAVFGEEFLQALVSITQTAVVEFVCLALHLIAGENLSSKELAFAISFPFLSPPLFYSLLNIVDLSKPIDPGDKESYGRYLRERLAEHDWTKFLSPYNLNEYLVFPTVLAILNQRKTFIRSKQ